MVISVELRLQQIWPSKIASFCDCKGAAVQWASCDKVFLLCCVVCLSFSYKNRSFPLAKNRQSIQQSTNSRIMLLSMLCLSSVWALMPLTATAFPTGSNGLGTSNTLPDQLFGRDQAAHERTARSIAHVKRASTAMVPTSIDQNDFTPIYTFAKSKPQVSTNIFGNLTAPGGNAAGDGPPSVINFKWGIGPVVVRAFS